jgi:hypothetical protein
MITSIEELIDTNNHDGTCDSCNTSGLNNKNVVKGDLGWYCSTSCKEDAEPLDFWSEEELQRVIL